MTEVIKALPALLVGVLVAAPSLVAGLRGHLLLGCLWPAVFVVFAAITTLNEAPHYDMHGSGLVLFGSAAVAASVGLVVGLVLRRLGVGRNA